MLFFVLSFALAWADQLNCAKFTLAQKNEFFAMDYKTFDSDDKGWRCYPFRNPECAMTMALLQQRYLTQNSAKLTPRQRMLTEIHEAQFLAQAGMKEVAISKLDTAAYPEIEADDKLLIRGLLAFLKADRAELSAARDEISKMKSERALGVKKALDKFNECFGRPYRDTFLENCASPAKERPPAD
jgi:hypothetical protein